MHVEIENTLNCSTIDNLVEALEDHYVESVELLPEVDCDCVTASSVTVRPSGTGYSISTHISFEKPLGYTICHNAGIKEQGIRKYQNKLELELVRSSVKAEELRADIEYAATLVKETVNYACNISHEARYDRLVLDSQSVSHQLQRSKTEKRIDLRGEKIAPFEVVHAESGKDLKSLNSDFVPIFEGYDKYDLYDGKEEFWLVPRSFGARLLTCEKDRLVPEDQFNAQERNCLKELVKKGYVKCRKVAGKSYFYELNEKTRLYLVKALRTRTP